MLRAHFFDFLSKFGKREQFSIVLKKIMESLLPSNGRFHTFAKLVLLRLLVLVHDSAITEAVFSELSEHS